jgi:hypothetical protein
VTNKPTGRVEGTRPATATPSAAHNVPERDDNFADVTEVVAEAVAGWEERLAASIAQQRERAAAKKAFRTEHERRRQYAHPKRHAAKLEAHRG